MRTYFEIGEKAEGIAKKALEQEYLKFVDISIMKGFCAIFLCNLKDKREQFSFSSISSEEENLNVLDKMIQFINE